MIDEIRSNRSWKIYALFIGAMGLCAFLVWMVFYPEEPAAALHAPPMYTPPLSLEERILEADVIARVRLRSVSSGAEPLDPDEEDVRANEYVGALVYTFQVLEYLKGSGGSQIVGIVHTGYSSQGYASQQEAAIEGDGLLKGRDIQWDDREAIVFLRDGWILASTQQADRYFFGTQSYQGDGYTIASRFSKRWLPAASAGGASGASGSGGQRFLTDEPPGGSSEGVSGDSGQTPSMSLAELKTRIGAMESLVNAGGGSDEYRECLIAKYEWERDIQHYNYVDQRYDYNFESGLPAGGYMKTGGRLTHGSILRLIHKPLVLNTGLRAETKICSMLSIPASYLRSARFLKGSTRCTTKCAGISSSSATHTLNLKEQEMSM